MTLGKSLDFVPQFSPVINRPGSLCWDRTWGGAVKRGLQNSAVAVFCCEGREVAMSVSV